MKVLRETSGQRPSVQKCLKSTNGFLSSGLRLKSFQSAITITIEKTPMGELLKGISKFLLLYGVSSI